MGKASRKRVGLRRWWVSLLLLAALAADVRIVLNQSRNRGAGGEGWLATVAGLRHNEWSGENITHDLYVIRGKSAGEPLRVLDPETDSWGELATLHESATERVMKVTFQAAESRRGAWAATRQEVDVSLEFEPFADNAFSPEQMAEARRLSAAYFSKTDDGRWAEAVARAAGGTVSWSRLLWLGYLHDAAALIAVAGFVWSLGWIPRSMGALRNRRGKRRLAAGLCPGCGYELRGLAEDVCPECGVRIGAASAPAAQGT